MLFQIHQIAETEVELLERLNTVFGEVFSDRKTYIENRPEASYLQALLRSDHFIALVAMVGKDIIGGLVAYELKKFEQNRSEIYIYDLAVKEASRRKGVATALIESLKKIGSERGAYVIFVQADTGAEDVPAIELYSKLGLREDVLHFDIQIEQ